jgi:hypothetical protein
MMIFRQNTFIRMMILFNIRFVCNSSSTLSFFFFYNPVDDSVAVVTSASWSARKVAVSR